MRPLIAALLLAVLSITPARAEVGVCYTEPVVHLDGGQIVDLSVRTDRSVQHISYVVHVPVGSTVKNITNPDPDLNSITVVPDGGYSVLVNISPELPATLTMRVPSVGSASATGLPLLYLHIA